MFKHYLRVVTQPSVIVILVIFPCCAPPKPKKISNSEKKETIALFIRGKKIVAEVARTPDKQAQGLMFRYTLSPDSGMFFVFERDETLRFWMKNCYIPLSIAFIDSDGIITDIQEMIPLDTVPRYVSSRPVRYALEAIAGWFSFNKIKPGDTVRGFK
jgi:uncharacterized membrane protein (UPF0127 family)|uniref:DUF192 domain-containing protein n=1 Tax=candidate division WOR-3 bacterium TaxID=2052148 RepID=A0A7V3V0B2_UNCW3